MLQIKKIKAGIFTIALLLCTVICMANEENPTAKSKALSVTFINKTSVKVSAQFNKNNSTFKIERSYDNKSFETVAVVLPAEDMLVGTPMVMNDKVKKGKKTVYYRVTETTENNEIISVTEIAKY